MLQAPLPALDGRVVHVVGTITDDVFRFLGPATRVLAEAGREQIVVLIDAARYRHHLARLHPSVVPVLIPANRNPFATWTSMLRACKDVFGRQGVGGAHLHGVMPCTVALLALNTTRTDIPVFFSPHASPASEGLALVGRLVGRFFNLLAGRFLRVTGHAVIVNVATEVETSRTGKSANLVESPVDDVFFRAERREAACPLIVTGGREEDNATAELFVQLAVLLSGEDVQVSFQWLGTVDPAMLVRFKAAGVRVSDPVTHGEWASLLSTGWVYIATGSPRNFPLCLVQAMAAGLPCIAFDCSEHRDVVAEGRTGFFGHDVRDMVQYIAMLVDSPMLRSQIGKAAREATRRRFSASDFRHKLLAAYGKRAAPSKRQSRSSAIDDRPARAADPAARNATRIVRAKVTTSAANRSIGSSD